MFEDSFIKRLASLREQKGVSAREMSLALGQNESYINRIENGKTFPSLQAFFYICEYLQVSPKEFFDEDSPSPIKVAQIAAELQKLDEVQLDTILAVIRGLQHRPG
nr:helix-turn-helix transcriptional regulator [uncultured Acetatifactor sp.]